MVTRKIIHVDMDAFYASVEQRDHPQWRGKPLAVGGASRRGVVAAASYEARAFGVYSAMPSVTATRKCPDLIFAPPRFQVYKDVSAQIHAIFHRFTDLVEPLSLDEAYLDVTHNKPGLTSATDCAVAIKRLIKQHTGLTASAGISVNKFLAKVASDLDKPDGLTVIKPTQVQAFIDQLPIERFFGVGKVTAKRMQALGITNGLTLRQWSEADLVQQFGKSGHYYYQVSRGQDDRPVESSRVRKSIGAECTFREDLVSLPDVEEQLWHIAEEVGERMRRADRLGRTITLKIKYADFHQVTRARTPGGLFADADSLFEAIKPVMTQEFKSGDRIRLLGITVSNLVRGKEQEQQLEFGFQ